MNAAMAVTVKSMILFIHMSSSKSEKSVKNNMNNMTGVCDVLNGV